MEIQGPGNINKAHGIEPTRSVNRAEKTEQSTPVSREDAVELTEISKLLSRLSSTPEIRHERVEAIRQEIEHGEYLTDDKLNSAVNRLVDLLE
jgi:flagellar biosynthesis anti-sigma factor FlgM